jgi:hypothetical protein
VVLRTGKCIVLTEAQYDAVKGLMAAAMMLEAGEQIPSLGPLIAKSARGALRQALNACIVADLPRQGDT